MSRAAAAKQKRKERLKYGDPKLRMTVDPSTKDKFDTQGLVPRWVNDDNKGRINKLKMRGYEFVRDDSVQVGDDDGNTDMGSAVSRVVGSDSNGNPIRSYLMVQRKEHYEEDQLEKEKINQRVDDAIRRGDPNGPQQTTVNEQGGRTFVKSVEYQP